MYKFKINSLTLNSKQTISLAEDTLTIIIGPNNSGKSTLLRDIDKALRGDSNRLILSAIDINLEGNSEDFGNWLGINYPIKDYGGGESFVTIGSQISKAISPVVMRQFSDYLNFISKYLNTETRLSIVSAKRSIAIHQSPPTEYIHILQEKPDLMQKISSEIKAVFGKDLIINFCGGEQVYFHFGDEPKFPDKLSAEYIIDLVKVSRLDSSGDGLKSYVGCLLPVKCAAYFLLLIDEPEVFLHPPQSKRLGRTLAESAKELNRQIVVSTHSSAFIQGALSSQGNVSVCRLSRDGAINNISVLDHNTLKELWSKPLLQSSGAIDGIFHEGVVVCEADADCRFYEALIRQKELNGEFNKPADLHFIHGGGKGEIPTLVKSYKSLNVPCVAIADFDLLQNKRQFQMVFESLGGEFSQIEREYKSSITALNDLTPIKNIGEFTVAINKVIEEINITGGISNKHKDNISNLLSESTDWSNAKKFGIDQLSGGKYNDCKKLLAECESIGLYILPTGELESWWRGGPSNKSKWILDSLDKIPLNDGTFKTAYEFIDKICYFFLMN